ncbi:MAG TPA: AgmX/PglI C-terminal domain-containing protein [Kofleriaceae bacterium]|nr:AgmX/PglI C-terminal domain-containing protein [Kofleriaceae bacterium]
MRKLLLPSLVLVGCWTSSKPASTPRPVEGASTGGAAYGGAAYGGSAYGLADGGAFASLVGDGDVSGGFDSGNIYGGVLGGPAGGTGAGSGAAILATATVTVGQPTSVGDLDPAIIRRYIKRNQAHIQYCYEKELASKPSLAGTVTVRFMIETNGRVTNARGAGMPVVEDCVAKVIETIEFPKPKQGAVNVSYPFVFSTTP